MEAKPIIEDPLESFMHEALAQDPNASERDIVSRWRSRRGETLGTAESERLSEVYNREAPASKAAAAERRAATGIDDIPPFRLTSREIVGILAALAPFVWPVVSSTTFRNRDGVVTGGTFFSLGGIVGGVIAIGLGIAAARIALRLARGNAVQIAHLALAAVILLFGAYHLLFGFGILHRLGIYGFS